MDIRQLRYFISVAEHLNFSVAATQLHITQPALSKQIADLEAEIGQKLFARNTRSVELTAAGVALLNKATTIVTKADSAISRARQAANGYSGNLQIGILSPFEKKELPALVTKFHHKYPESIVSFTILGWKSLNEALINGSVDIAFTPSQGIDEVPELAWLPTHHSYPLSLVVPNDHPLAKADSVDICALAHEHFVMLSQAEYPLAYKHMRQLCISHGFYPNIVSEAPVLETLLLMVATGIGVTIHSKLTDAYAISNLHFIPLKNCPFTFDLVVAWQKATSSPLVQPFLQTLKDENFIL